jgi:hypothetical protein
LSRRFGVTTRCDASSKCSTTLSTRTGSVRSSISLHTIRRCDSFRRSCFASGAIGARRQPLVRQTAMVACGFKVLPDHLKPPAHLDQLLQSGSPRVILLERSDSRAQHASLKRALATGRWGFAADVATKQEVCQPADEECVHRVAAAFSWTPGASAAGSLEAFLKAREAWHSIVRQAVKRAGSPLLLVWTESLNDTRTLNTTMARVLRFLRRPDLHA